MTKIYDISIKKTIYGFCKIQANNEEEARQKANQEINQEEQIEYFEDDNNKEIIGIECIEEI